MYKQECCSAIIYAFIRYGKSLHTSLVANQAGAYLRFQWHEATRSISTPPRDGMLVHHRVTPSIEFAGTHFCTGVERGTLRLKCLVQVI